MKNWYLIPLAALAGLVAGSWGPREDAAAREGRSAESRAVRTASDAAGFGAFAKMVKIPDVAKRTQRRNPRGRREAEPSTNAVSAADAAQEPQRPGRAARRAAMLSPDDLRARIDEASDIWRTRVEIAKVQWKSKLGVADGAAFDGVLDKMNDSLSATMNALAAEIAKAGRMTPELGLRLMGDASAAMAEAYDGIGSLLPESRRGEVSELPVFEFIDPSVADPLVEVQTLLQE